MLNKKSKVSWREFVLIGLIIILLGLLVGVMFYHTSSKMECSSQLIFAGEWIQYGAEQLNITINEFSNNFVSYKLKGGSS